MKSVDIFGIGNAVVDMDYRVEDSFLVAHGLDKGHMTLIDAERMRYLLAQLPEEPHAFTCGGSAANTVYTARGFQCAAFLACRVVNDDVGEFYRRSHLEAGIGVSAEAHNTADAEMSGRCLILITPDAQRTLNTCLAASERLSERQIDFAVLRQSAIVFLEGYLASSPTGTQAASTAGSFGHQHGAEVCVTLSDPVLIQLYRANLETMLGNGVRWLFCNEEEALAWVGTDRLDIAANELRDIGKTALITLGSRGCVLRTQGTHREIKGYKVDAVDEAGAGDMFAGAFLASMRQGSNEYDAADFANFAAARVVAAIGPRYANVNAYRQLRTEFVHTAA